MNLRKSFSNASRFVFSVASILFNIGQTLLPVKTCLDNLAGTRRKIHTEEKKQQFSILSG